MLILRETTFLSLVQEKIVKIAFFSVFSKATLLNFVLLKILVEYLYVNAIVAQVISTVVVIIISYLLQRHFSFRIENTEVD